MPDTERKSQLPDEPQVSLSQSPDEAPPEHPWAKDTPKPGEEIQLNLKKFAIFLGIILFLATIGGAMAEFGP
ncbi:hypothetical protein GKN94_10985 [Candidatus Lucifugimonas marina]|uniref:hypothetical protein n=1 Tax=Candidatus Lucifugimonas marina TaxID=3038979 RepID=UPI0027A3037B|nr:hypothetical protein GKN94_10985 [SAR202 cluster bacterium JH545]